MRLGLTPLALALASACVSADPPDAVGDSGEVELPRGCPPPAGAPTRPQSIEDVVALLNALPKPTSLACFLESLERPLAVYATSHAFSAQPADGEGSPRLFVFFEPLVLSVVPVGIGRHLLEMAVDVGDERSIKAELVFPVQAELQPAAPFQQVEQGGSTTCAGCHPSESRATAITYAAAYVSDALQPPADTEVPVAFVLEHQRACDRASEPERCEILDAVFGHGEVVAHAFAPTYRICIAP